MDRILQGSFFPAALSSASVTKASNELLEEISLRETDHEHEETLEGPDGSHNLKRSCLSKVIEDWLVWVQKRDRLIHNEEHVGLVNHKRCHLEYLSH